MQNLVYEATDEAATAALGAALAECLPAGSVVSLIGTLGSGKTRLVQALAAAAGVERGEAVSPTFVLVHEYQGRRPIYHIDAYRVRGEEEFWDLGPDEYFEGDGVGLVEWADRVPGCLPRERLEIHIEVTGPQSRRFLLTALGPRYETVLERLGRR